MRDLDPEHCRSVLRALWEALPAEDLQRACREEIGVKPHDELVRDLGRALEGLRDDEVRLLYNHAVAAFSRGLVRHGVTRH